MVDVVAVVDVVEDVVVEEEAAVVVVCWIVGVAASGFVLPVQPQNDASDTSNITMAISRLSMGLFQDNLR